MTQGFVYILLNPAFPDLVKIGRTKNPTEKRAKELRGTGVPTPFIVVYEEIVSDAKKVESKLHERYAGYRVSNDREFFRIPLKEAIKALQAEANQFALRSTDQSRVEILPDLKKKYGDKIRNNITSVGIVQVPDVCFLETVTVPSIDFPYKDNVVSRIDLSFIGGGRYSSLQFPPDTDVSTNAKNFITELDEISLYNICDLLK